VTAGSTNVIQISTNLLDWSPWLTNVATNNTWLFTDPATHIPQRYYRAVTP